MRIIRNDNSFTVDDFAWNRNKYQYKKFSRQEENGQRTYNVDNKKIPSVTTILSATKSQEDIDSLRRWRDRIGDEAARKTTIDAARRGTEMHYVLEQYINGVGYLNLSKEGAQARLMAHEIVNNLGPLKVVYGNEVSLAYEDRWAGSTDLVGLFDDKPTIIDFKQSNKLKKEEWIEDYYYQIAAYSLAHRKSFGPILQGVICICTKEVEYQQFKMDTQMLARYEDKWFERVEQYEKLNQNNA